MGNLHQLIRLELNGNDLTTIEPLAGLTNLTKLGIACTMIEYLKPVENMKQLKILDIYMTPTINSFVKDDASSDNDEWEEVVLPDTLTDLDIRQTDISHEFIRELYPNITNLVW